MQTLKPSGLQSRERGSFTLVVPPSRNSEGRDVTSFLVPTTKLLSARSCIAGAAGTGELGYSTPGEGSVAPASPVSPDPCCRSKVSA